MESNHLKYMRHRVTNKQTLNRRSQTNASINFQLALRTCRVNKNNFQQTHPKITHTHIFTHALTQTNHPPMKHVPIKKINTVECEIPVCGFQGVCNRIVADRFNYLEICEAINIIDLHDLVLVSIVLTYSRIDITVFIVIKSMT